MGYIIVLLLFSVYTVNIQATTHWMVTESGLIEPKEDSPFQLINSHDLIAFLNQDTKWDNIINVYHNLSKRRSVINKLWTKLNEDLDITTHMTLNKHCLEVRALNMIDWYSSHLEEGTSKGIPEKEFLLYNPSFGQSVDVPDCKKISSLTFSMFAYEHLEGMIERENLTGPAELTLPNLISPIMTIDQFGHWVANVLRKNSSSWLHYNMASLYWRVRGNAHKAIECSRRALHYAPRRYKEIPLLGLGTVLLRSKKLEDAATVLAAAVDHNPNCALSHFTLANTYAVLGDFNSSLRHINKCLQLVKPCDFRKNAEKHRHAVICHAFLLEKMILVQEGLTKLSIELKDYTTTEAYWFKTQAALLKTMKHAEEYDFRNAEKNCERISEISGIDMMELKRNGDRFSLIQYLLHSVLYSEVWLKDRGVNVLDAAYNLQMLIESLDKHSGITAKFVIPTDYVPVVKGVQKEIGPTPVLPDITRGKTKAEAAKSTSAEANIEKSTSQPAELLEFDIGVTMYPPTMKINRNLEEFDRDVDWPSNRFCKEKAHTFPGNLEAIYPVFLPFENKGIRLVSLLTSKIGVPANVEHELPWHPPTCPQDKEATAFTQKKSQKQQLISEVGVTPYLRQKLLEYVGDGHAHTVKHMQDAEIGQRIYAAMQMDLVPKWLLYTLSSLYWRVRGNNINALHCLLSASRTVQARHKDIVLASLASVYLEMGHFDEALTAAEEAFKLSLYEPATNFILAELNMIKKHRNTQLFHLKQVLRVEPSFMGGLVRYLLNGWACVLKQVNTLEELDFGEGDICTQVEPGMSMVCEKDGINCHVANIQCYSGHEKDSSTLVKMLQLKEDVTDYSTSENFDGSIFDSFLHGMPKEKSDKAGHYDNFQNMIRLIERELKGCGLSGCSSIAAEDLALKEDDCTYQHLQIGYWIHIISFKQLLSDSNLRLPPEIATITPSNKKIPECRLTSDPADDFFLERMSSVDTEGWEPVLSLMQQFAELFNYFDYVTLGAKIAKYVDTKPRSWVSALGAGWWCGAGGRGGCSLRCLAAAYALAPPAQAHHAVRALAAILHMQSKLQDAKDIAYLSFYMSPKSQIEAFLVAVSHTYLAEYDQAVWMYRYSLTFDEKFLPAKACLHATMCLMIFGESAKKTRD